MSLEDRFSGIEGQCFFVHSFFCRMKILCVTFSISHSYVCRSIMRDHPSDFVVFLFVCLLGLYVPVNHFSVILRRLPVFNQY